MKIKVDLTGIEEQLGKGAIITNKDLIPLTVGYDQNRVIGFGHLTKNEDGYTWESANFNCGIAGKIIEREGNLITKFEITECSIIMEPKKKKQNG